MKEALIETREELLEEPGKLFDYIRVSQAMIPASRATSRKLRLEKLRSALN